VSIKSNSLRLLLLFQQQCVQIGGFLYSPCMPFYTDGFDYKYYKKNTPFDIVVVVCGSSRYDTIKCWKKSVFFLVHFQGEGRGLKKRTSYVPLIGVDLTGILGGAWRDLL